jgi:glycosyltransferase involved in cell wall biosynthesis
MNVLLVSEDVPRPWLGGLAKQAVRLGNALLERGHAVTLMGLAGAFDYAQCEVGFNGPYVAGFNFEGCGWKEHALGVFLPYRRSHAAKRIAHAILARAGGFDVVHYHGHFPMLGRYIPPHVNFVQTRHDHGSECMVHLRFRRGRPCTASDPRACAACATAEPNFVQSAISAAAVRQYRRHAAEAFSRHKTIFVSDFLRRRFDGVVPGERSRTTFVVHNFLDLKSLPDRPPPAIPAGNTRRVAIAARLDEVKGVEAFLEVLLRLRPGRIEVDIVGDGPRRASAERRFASAAVRFLGWCSEAQTVQQVLAADALVMPSILEEPFGLSTLEGLALGKPVFALALGGTPEVRRYQRWDGQLALFDSMDKLVCALADCPLPLAQSYRDFSGDAARLVPQVIAVYQARA